VNYCKKRKGAEGGKKADEKRAARETLPAKRVDGSADP